MIKCYICDNEREEKDTRITHQLDFLTFRFVSVCFDCIWRAHEAAQVPEYEYPDDLRKWLGSRKTK